MSDRHAERDPHTCNLVRTCNVVNRDCKAPPAAFGYTAATCYACGMPACTGPHCSKLVEYLGLKKRRLCPSCERDHKMSQARAAERDGRPKTLLGKIVVTHQIRIVDGRRYAIANLDEPGTFHLFLVSDGKRQRYSLVDTAATFAECMRLARRHQKD